MEITIEISEQLITSRMQSEVARLIGNEIDTQVRNKFQTKSVEVRKAINEAVDTYLAKRMTADFIKSEIDKSILAKVQQLIDENSR